MNPITIGTLVENVLSMSTASFFVDSVVIIGVAVVVELVIEGFGVEIFCIEGFDVDGLGIVVAMALAEGIVAFFVSVVIELARNLIMNM